MNKRLQIFISSTYTDLKEERQAAVEAILSAGHIPAGMELFNAGNESQLETIKRWIDDSDVYLLILGGRYGTIEQNSGLSYTEIEYQYALEQNKKLFAVVINNSALNEKIKIHGQQVIETSDRSKYEEFKSVVESKVVRFFDDTKDIKLAIHETLNRYIQEHNFTGWVSGRHVENIEKLQKANIKLQHDNLLLQRRIEKLTAVTKKSYNNGMTYQDILTFLSGQKCIFPAKYNPLKQDFQTDILNLFVTFRNSFTTGITNYQDNVLMWLFYNTAPPLINSGLVRFEKLIDRNYDKIVTTDDGNKFLTEFSLNSTDLTGSGMQTKIGYPTSIEII